jgi:HPt (histidine-containing phosphotransfer) domain-containing protein
MLATCPSTNRFSGAVPALLVWANGDMERLADLTAGFCPNADGLDRTLSRELEASNAQEVRRAAHILDGLLSNLGVPQLRVAAATLEEFARTNDLESALSVIDELSATLHHFSTFLAKKPWLRY